MQPQKPIKGYTDQGVVHEYPEWNHPGVGLDTKAIRAMQDAPPIQIASTAPVAPLAQPKAAAVPAAKAARFRKRSD
jgi:hypothetical protein